MLIIKLYYNRKYVYYVLEIMNKKNYTIVEKITLHLFTLVVMSAFISSILISRTIFCSKCISRGGCVCVYHLRAIPSYCIQPEATLRNRDSF